MAGASYDLDFDHQFIETEKYDAKDDLQEVHRLQSRRGRHWRPHRGYREPRRPLGPRDALQAKNANVRFHQQDTLERIFSNLESEDIHIRRARMDCGSCSRKIVETVDGVRGNWA